MHNIQTTSFPLLKPKFVIKACLSHSASQSQ